MQWKRSAVARKTRNVCALAAVLALSAFSVERGNGAEARAKAGTRAAAGAQEFMVRIEGFVDVNSSPSCNLKYQAVATGGADGYTYVWESTGEIKQNWGDVIWGSFSPSGGHYLTVTVTDASGAQTGSTAAIISSTSEYECYQ